MSFTLRGGALVSDVLSQFDWIDHGFGTRAANLMDTSGAAMLKQVHSDVCAVATSGGVLGEGDALVTNRTGLAIGVKTADCVPILIVDPVNRAAAAIHAGWRGTVAGIAAKTVRSLAVEFGAEPSDLIAVIGPSIGGCCFEVGPEVAERFGRPPSRTYIDLAGENEKQLEAAGVKRVASAGMCTKCAIKPTFESFRRDGEASGRMFSYVRIR